MDAVPLGRLAALIGRSSEEVLGYFAARTVVVALVLEVGGSLAVLYWLVGGPLPLPLPLALTIALTLEP